MSFESGLQDNKREGLLSENLKVSARINFKEYFNSYRSFISTEMPWAFKGNWKKSKNSSSTVLGQPIRRKKYEEACRVSLLDIPLELPPVDDAFLNGKKFCDNFVVPNQHNLHTLCADDEEFSECRKYGNRIWKKIPDEEQDLEVNSEIVISLRVYEPIKSEVAPGLLRNHKDASEILVLGSQTLAEFRDAIVCTTDVTVPGELSDDPERARGYQGKDMFKSGFIFIENVFYNDFRHVTSIDYSEPIIKWAESRKLGPYTTKEMKKVRFIDLTVRLGYPYVYIHQGNCEHLIVFSKARFLHTNDSLERKKYPICLPVYGKQARFCMMCYQYLARWLVKENDRLPHDTFFFCNDCFLSFNYINGRKIGNFQAYMYQERLAFI